MRDENRFEWILDDVGRGWRENEKGQTLLLDEVGRTWKFDNDGKGTGKVMCLLDVEMVNQLVLKKRL